MATSDPFLYLGGNLVHTQERMSGYMPGGYHPISLGDRFKEGRYEVCHKLGWGGFSTVWLAWDEELKMWVSIKVKCADNTENYREIKALRAFQETAVSHQIVSLLDDFLHDGPNGCHQCLVFEFLGPSVDYVTADYFEAGDQLDAGIILRLTTQMLEAIAHVHQFGYVHGDISGSNFAFTCSKLATLPRDELFNILESPIIETVTRADGQALGLSVPKHMVKKADWVDWADEDEEDIRLIDFGETFLQGAKPDRLAQPPDLRAPETVFTDHFDHRLDLWRAGLTIYTLLFGCRPFHHWGGVDKIVHQMIGFVEELPEEWQSQWMVLQKEAGELRSPPSMFALLSSMNESSHTDPASLTHSSLADNPTESKLRSKFHEKILDPDLQHLLPIIEGLVRFRPSERISATRALEMLDEYGYDEGRSQSSWEETSNDE